MITRCKESVSYIPYLGDNFIATLKCICNICNCEIPYILDHISSIHANPLLLYILLQLTEKQYHCNVLTFSSAMIVRDLNTFAYEFISVQ